MSLPIVRQEYAAQIRMIVKDNPEEIESFALVPIRSAPDACNRRHVRIIFVQQDLQAQPVMPGG